MSGEAQLEALLEIIVTSARQAIAEYKKGGHDVPTVHSKTCHPIDHATDTVELKSVMRVLEGACAQLCASLVPPRNTIMDFGSPYEWACMRVVVRAKVADALEHHPDGLHIDDLAKKVQLDKGKLARVLRCLAARGCFTELKPNVFANNRPSLFTLSSSDINPVLRIGGDDQFSTALVLYETMTDPDYASSYRQEKAPVLYALGKKDFDGNYFDLVTQDPLRRQTFHRSMIGLNNVMGSLSVLHHYPWNEVNTVCDVGAGVGSISRPLVKTYPHLRLTNQDLPDVLTHAKEVWAKDAPETLQNNQVEFVPLDFFDSSPVHGQDVYYLRNIVHNWSDDKAAIILKHVQKAMTPQSRLLIHGTVLTHLSGGAGATPFGLNVTPEALSPGFGNRAYRRDMTMWFILNARERTLNEFIALGSEAGLRLEKVYDLVDTAVLDFRVIT